MLCFLPSKARIFTVFCGVEGCLGGSKVMAFLFSVGDYIHVQWIAEFMDPGKHQMGMEKGTVMGQVHLELKMC